MSNRNAHHLSLPRWIGKCFTHAPRLVRELAWTQGTGCLPARSDSAWAVDGSTPESICGGTFVAGRRSAKTLPAPQQVAASNVAWVELHALLHCACQCFGAISRAEEFGYEVGLVARYDASAPPSHCAAQGLGKSRHLRVQWRWLQERARDEDLMLSKFNGNELLS